MSAPCKGFSGLLSETRSRTDKYQALNALTLRGVWLALEAWKNDPVSLIVFENVPRIANRGRTLLDRIVALLRSYGYAVAETTHDCGELGGLAQSRKRFLLVARHMQKVPPFLYEPEKRSLRAVGDVLGKLPIPGHGIGGAMHRVPSLQWKTWVRLAFVEAGKDWRSLNRLKVEDGNWRTISSSQALDWKARDNLASTNGRDFRDRAGASRPGNGKFSVADPRFRQSAKWNEGNSLGVKDWQQAASTIGAGSMPGQGAYSVADPRMSGETADTRHKNVFRSLSMTRLQGPYQAVTVHPAAANALPIRRPPEDKFRAYNVSDWKGQTGTVMIATIMEHMASRTRASKLIVMGRLACVHGISQRGTVAGESFPTNGAFTVADPRAMNREKGDNYLTGGHYGVVPWDSRRVRFQLPHVTTMAVGVSLTRACRARKNISLP